MISSVTTFPVSVPYSVKTTWSRGEGERTHNLIVRITTDHGEVGWGESISPSVEGARGIIERDLAPLLVEREPNINEFLERARLPLEYLPGANWAISGVEMALWDLLGRRLNAPVADMLGGKRREVVDAIGYLFIDEPSVNAAQAEAFAADGHRTIKMKIGRSSDLDEKRVAAVRTAVGEGILIRIDPNAAWTRHEAIENLRRLSRYEVEYVEQPLHPRDLEGLAQLRRMGISPIAADESCGTFSDARRLIEASAVDVLVVYVTQAGGILEARRIGEFAAEHGVRCVMGSASELGIATAAQTIVSACAPGYSGANDTHLPLQTDDVCVVSAALAGGAFIVPSGAGLGIEVDEHKLTSLRDTLEGASYSLQNEAAVAATVQGALR